MRFVEKLITQKGNDAYLLKTKDISGREAFYVLMPNPKMKQAFLALENNEPADLKDYGVILASGFGHIVPDSVRQELMAKYQINVPA